jgi:hypothetical protein
MSILSPSTILFAPCLFRRTIGMGSARLSVKTLYSWTQGFFYHEKIKKKVALTFKLGYLKKGQTILHEKCLVFLATRFLVNTIDNSTSNST